MNRSRRRVDSDLEEPESHGQAYVGYVIGLYQAGSGVVGIPLLLNVLGQSASILEAKSLTAILSGLVALGVVLVFLFTFIAGLSLLLGSTMGWYFTLIVQLCQVPVVSLSGWAYSLTIGAGVFLGVWPGIQISFNTGSSFSVWFGGQEQPSYLAGC